MSKIVHAEKIVLSNNLLNKKELVGLVASSLNVSIANARVYIYNVNKRLNKQGKTAAEILTPAIKQEINAIVERNAVKAKRVKDSKILEPVTTAA